MAVLTREAADVLGWSFTLIGDTFDGGRVDRVSASKRFPDGNVKECTGIDEAQVHLESEIARLQATLAEVAQRLRQERAA